MRVLFKGLFFTLFLSGLFLLFSDQTFAAESVDQSCTLLTSVVPSPNNAWQEFVPSFNRLTKVSFYVSSYTHPTQMPDPTIVIGIKNNSGTVLTQGTLHTGTTSGTWFTYTFPNALEVTPGTIYRASLDSGSGPYISVGYSNQASCYPSGQAYFNGFPGGDWKDYNFMVYGYNYTAPAPTPPPSNPPKNTSPGTNASPTTTTDTTVTTQQAEATSAAKPKASSSSATTSAKKDSNKVVLILGTAGVVLLLLIVAGGGFVLYKYWLKKRQALEPPKPQSENTPGL